MDDIFDSLIYIVITIIAFAISFLGKKKKKPVTHAHVENFNQAPQQEQKPFFTTLEKLLAEEMGLGYENEFPYEEERKPVQQEKSVIESVEAGEILDTVPQETAESKIDNLYSIEYDDNAIKNSEMKISDITREEDLSNDVLDDFDLQKAVIYSEILQRKEY